MIEETLMNTNQSEIKKEKEKEKKKDNEKKLLLLLLLLLLLITIAAVGITIWAVWFRKPSIVLTPDYAPLETDKNVAQIPGDDTSDKMEAPEGGGAISVHYSKEVTIDLSDKKASLLYANPGKSTQDVVLQIVIQDNIIAQSGRIPPGSQLRTLDLLNGAAAKLAPGAYNGKFVLLCYNTETGEKAMVNTEARITITVH